ncbi:Oidioi.mRNA.OKI2018_I69.chr2.g5464.t1.cds [Oikopleura dioica]|uniref:Hexosyltransferase n=1 Tax=Oikopleura dioica TaxID=34765 RepID=A0ABN7T416_OIKDI|nr:Oidioi.mRNA.OKI2018_I69.chr2.g5464.t1.cds [Oikopleura dioica]
MTGSQLNSNGSLQLVNFFTENCPAAKIIIKADDDIFLNPLVLIRTLELYVLRYPEPPMNGTYHKFGETARKYKDTIEILGNIILHAAPKESPFDKYFVPASISESIVDESHRYPDYFSGALFVMTNKGMRKFAKEALENPTFPIDDVWVRETFVKANLSENFHFEPLFYQGFFIETKTNSSLILSCYLAGLPVFHKLNKEQRLATFTMMHHLDANKCINDEILPRIFDEFTGLDRAIDFSGPKSTKTRSQKFQALNFFAGKELMRYWCRNLTKLPGWGGRHLQICHNFVSKQHSPRIILKI